MDAVLDVSLGKLRKKKKKNRQDKSGKYLSLSVFFLGGRRVIVVFNSH